MKSLVVLAVTMLVLSIGCNKKPVALGIAPGSGESQASDSVDAQASDMNVTREHELSLSPTAPVSRGGKDSEEIHVRYKLAAKNPGKLLVRVREPLVSGPAPTVNMPGLTTTAPADWAQAAGSAESEGVSQWVLDLTKEDLADTLSIECRVAHAKEDGEMVRVDLWMQKGEADEETRLNFYECRPAANTTRSSKTAMDREAVLDTGATTLLCSYDFGGEATDLEVPLTRDGKQLVIVELGWKSSLDHTP